MCSYYVHKTLDTLYYVYNCSQHQFYLADIPDIHTLPCTLHPGRSNVVIKITLAFESTSLYIEYIQSIYVHTVDIRMYLWWGV